MWCVCVCVYVCRACVCYSRILEKNMQLLMTSVDSLQQDTYRLLGYEKQLAKNSQAKQQLLQKKVIWTMEGSVG